MDSATFTGGLRIGESYWIALNFSWPLAKLSLFADRLEIASVFGCIRLKREQITCIRAYRGLISDGVQFEHTSTSQQPFIVFWISPQNVAPTLQHFGFAIQPISDSGQVARWRARLSVTRFIVLFVLVFAFLLMHEFHRPQSRPDAWLNAVGLTVFTATASWFLRRRLVR